MTAGALFSGSLLNLAIRPSPSAYSLSYRQLFHGRRGDAFKFNSINSSRRSKDGEFANVATKVPSSTVLCNAQKVTTSKQPSDENGDSNGIRRPALQRLLWAAEGVYILWLFLLPYAPVCVLCLFTFPVASIYTFITYGNRARKSLTRCLKRARVNNPRFWFRKQGCLPLSKDPEGDPVWAISSDTVNSLVGLSLNFFFILPLMNYVGIHLIDAPVLHPISEGLFNFVLGWTFMFAPLLFTDCKRDRYKGSLDILWGLQMFLTNTFLIPYMAIRLNDADAEYAPGKPSQLGSVMTNGATVVGLVGGAVCLVSILWGLFGRMDADFGNVTERWDFLISYLGAERLAYAFIWDICLYIIFQPWLIGDNLQNVQQNKARQVSTLRFIPVVGLVAYLLSLNTDIEV